MSFYKSYGRLGAYGASGFEVFVGGPAFQERWSLDDFTGTSVGWLSSYNVQQTGYSPPSTGILRAASAIWGQLANAVDPNDLAFLDKMTTQMHALIATIDNYTGQHTSGTRSPAIENARVDAMKQLQKCIRQIAAYRPAPAPPPPDPLTTVPVSTRSSSGASTMAPVTEHSNTLLYVGLGVGALVLIGGAIALRKKSSGKRRQR